MSKQRIQSLWSARSSYAQLPKAIASSDPDHATVLVTWRFAGWMPPGSAYVESNPVKAGLVDLKER
jgi:hypothetical protein